MTHIIYFASDYLPRRGRIQEGDALAVYFSMNISSVLGDIHLSGKKVYTLFIAPSGEMPKAEGDALVAYFAMNIASVLGDIHLSGKNR